jgi:acyl-CoA synthetase (AMP-forming)/AMP-acid ligase II
MIVTGGLNVYPREVELALEEHPSVRQAGVVGLPSERWGEEVVAVVVPAAADGDLDPDALGAHVRERLAPFKCPKRIVTADGLPVNAMGKLRRRDLAKLVDAAACTG